MENMNRAAGSVISTEGARTNPNVNELLQGIREVTSEIKEMSEVIITEIITGPENPKENVKCASPEFDSKPVLDKLEYLSAELRDARAKYNKIIDVLK